MRNALRLSVYMFVSLGLYFVFLATTALPIHAETRVVTNILDSGNGSLRQLVNTAVDGDTIVFDPAIFSNTQTITLTSGPIVVTGSIVIDGAYGNVYTPTLSGGTTQQIMVIGPSVRVTLNHLAFIDAYSAAGWPTDEGGAIQNNAALTLTHVIFSNNYSASNAGAIINYGSLYADGVGFYDNHSEYYGGAIYHQGSSAIITGTNFQKNVSAEGGGIYMLDSSIVITSSSFITNFGLGGAIASIGNSYTSIYLTTFHENRSAQGGAIRSSGDTASLHIENCLFTSNGGQYGGAIQSETSAGSVTISNTTFFRNGAYTSGGAIQTAGGGVVKLENDTFMSNWANGAGNDGGGALWIGPNGHISILNSTIVSNVAGLNPPSASMLVKGGSINVRNSIVAFNNPPNSTVNGLAIWDGAITSLGNNMSNGTSIFTGTTDLSATIPFLTPLGNYGGAVPTLLLQLRSPGINAGNDAACPPTDARGVQRPQNGICDIGATESIIRGVFLPRVTR